MIASHNSILTPKENTPWWSLFHCCRPSHASSRDNDDHQEDPTHWCNDGVNVNVDSLDAVVVATPPFKCSAIYNDHALHVIPEDDHDANTNNVNHDPTCSSCSKDDESHPFPINDDIPHDNSSEIPSSSPQCGIMSNGKKRGMNNEGGEMIAMAFWRFLLLMMLRNVVGVDYVTNRLKCLTDGREDDSSAKRNSTEDGKGS
ncbi:hypothetical protein HJC23_013216 [Cyclotella cryptica]|uniref:Uncharacterized protein n=1 Tax=Cyclotella cryptica TaxID=29204 RepID=A0ABD3QC90_9STRA|eukprot:CCRYP_006662-RA/>CCRYP_006662-RA protein AED:0.18 eAED:0.18 QI:269/1/1/1/1/1/2/694/200